MEAIEYLWKDRKRRMRATELAGGDAGGEDYRESGDMDDDELD